jgi:hypothetical protein
MAGAKDVIFAFIYSQEWRKPVFFTNRMQAFFSSGQYLMRICLMSDIPYQFIVRCIENIVKRNRQLHDAKAGTEMPSYLRYCIDQILANVITGGAKI